MTTSALHHALSVYLEKYPDNEVVLLVPDDDGTKNFLFSVQRLSLHRNTWTFCIVAAPDAPNCGHAAFEKEPNQ